MNIRQLETFVAIHDQRGFKRAAEALNMTPSAVSMQVKTLEETLNVALFDRGSRPPALTNVGRAILEPARQILEQSEEVRRVAGLDQVVGKVVLGVIPSATVTLLPDALAFTTQHYPRLQVRVVAGLTDELLMRTVSGELDAALVTDPPHRDAKLRWNTVMEERFLVACHQDLFDGSAENVLRTLPFLRFNRETGIGWIVDRALRRQRIAVRDAMELDSVDAILNMVAHKHGVAIVPESSVLDHYRRLIRLMPFGRPPATRRIALAARVQPELAPLADALFEGLKIAAGKVAPR